MRVLVTRAADGAARSAARLRALGHEPLVVPLMEIAPLAVAPPDGAFQALVLTSANAIDALAACGALPALAAVPVWPVGGRTAEAAREAGFRAVMPPAGDGTALAQALVAALRPQDGPVLHAGGRDLAVDIAALMREAGFAAVHLAVYEARAATALPEEAASALAAGKVDAALLYSARSARILLDLAAAAGLAEGLRHIVLVAISDQVAEPLRQAGHSRIAVARRADEDGLLEALSSGPARGS